MQTFQWKEAVDPNVLTQTQKPPGFKNKLVIVSHKAKLSEFSLPIFDLRQMFKSLEAIADGFGVSQKPGKLRVVGRMLLPFSAHCLLLK